jgi:heat shock protein HtpX
LRSPPGCPVDERPQLEGVVAHELGHVLHRDILTSSIAYIGAAITHLAYMAMWFGGGHRDDREGSPWGGPLMVLLAPRGGFVQMAISARENTTPTQLAKYTGSPDGLINGLRKLEQGVERVPMNDASPATAHMFILNPFRAGGMSRLFSTHPSTEDRIARLEAMRGDAFRLSPVQTH